MALKLAALFNEFVKSTFMGHESGLFRTNVFEVLVPSIIPAVTRNYFNGFYDDHKDKAMRSS
jgi:hypothetical protein